MKGRPRIFCVEEESCLEDYVEWIGEEMSLEPMNKTKSVLLHYEIKELQKKKSMCEKVLRDNKCFFKQEGNVWKQRGSLFCCNQPILVGAKFQRQVNRK